MPAARVYIVRHGETEENKKSIIQGQRDTHLNNEGREQARLVAFALQEVAFDVAYTSDLIRASATAEAILAHHPGVRLQRQVELREKYMGDMEGKPYTRARKPLPTDDLGEKTDAFIARATSWWDHSIRKTVATLSPKPQDIPHNILVTTHGGFVGALVRNLVQGGSLKCRKEIAIWKCYNASITIIDVERDGVETLVQYSGIDHLQRRSIVDNNVDVVDDDEQA